jgi:hypothetical protein
MPNHWNLTSSRDINTPTCEDLPIDLDQCYGTSIEYVVDYNVALNFPIVDIMTFFPTVDKNQSRVQSARVAEVRFMCLRPEVWEGSRQARTAREVLEGMGGGGGGESGAGNLFVGNWAAVVVAFAVMFALNM